MAIRRVLDHYLHTAFAAARQLDPARYGEANTLTRLGDAHHQAGHSRAARAAWQEALTILNDLGDPDAGQIQAKLAALRALPAS